MLKKIACISIVILIVGALSLPCFAFEVPTYDENTTQLVYYISGQDDLFYVKNKDAYFLYNPTDSVQTVRLTLTNYFVWYSRFYIITSYSWINNNNCSIQYSSKFSDTTTYTFTDFIGGDYQSDFVSFVGTINPDGSDNVDFDTREIFCEISVNPGKVCAFQFAYNRLPTGNDDGPGADSAALMDQSGLMAYTAALYDVSRDFYGTGEGTDFDFFNLFNQIGQFTKLQGYNNGYGEGVTDGYNQASNIVGPDKFNEGYSAGFQSGYDSGDFDGWARGYQDGINTRFEDPDGEISTLAQAYDKGVSDGIAAAEKNGAINTKLYEFIPKIFGAILNSVFDFLDSFMSFDTLFGFNVKGIIITVVSVSLAVSLFGFLTSKIGGG